MGNLTNEKLTLADIKRVKELARKAKPFPTVIIDGVTYYKFSVPLRDDKHVRAAARKGLADWWAQRRKPED